jgi:hypothetical protein
MEIELPRYGGCLNGQPVGACIARGTARRGATHHTSDLPDPWRGPGQTARVRELTEILVGARPALPTRRMCRARLLTSWHPSESALNARQIQAGSADAD